MSDYEPIKRLRTYRLAVHWVWLAQVQFDPPAATLLFKPECYFTSLQPTAYVGRHLGSDRLIQTNRVKTSDQVFDQPGNSAGKTGQVEVIEPWPSPDTYWTELKLPPCNTGEHPTLGYQQPGYWGQIAWHRYG